MTTTRTLVTLAVCSILLVDAAQGQFDYYFGRNKVQYEEFDWHVLKTDHFDIFYYPEMQDLAEHGAYFAEEAYRELQARFEFSLTRRVPLIYYSSNLHFKQTNVSPGLIPDGVGGFFEFLKGRVVIPSNGNLHQFRRVIRHELVHVFTITRLLRVLQDHRVPQGRLLPLWFIEGLAEYWSGDRDPQHEMVMRDVVFSNHLLSLADIHRISGTFLMYKHGEAIMHFISETYGEEQILRIIEHVWIDTDIRRVLEFTLGESFSDINQAWLEWIRGHYYSEFDDVVPPSIASSSLGVQGFSSMPAFYRLHDGRRLVLYVGNEVGYTNLYSLHVDENLQPLGEPEILIRGERGAEYESFSPFESRISVSDTGRLAFVTRSGAHDVIHIYDLESREFGGTYGFEDLIALYSPDWHPDGDQFIFTGIGRDGFSDLYVYDMVTGTRQRLTNDIYDDRDPAWHPNGVEIAFSSDRGEMGSKGAYNLMLLNLEDHSLRSLTSGDRRDFSPRWSNDGTTIYFTSTIRDSTARFGAQNIWAADLTRHQENHYAAGASDPEHGHLVVSMERRLTTLTTAAFDPYVTDTGRLLFSTFENQRFAIRALRSVESVQPESSASPIASSDTSSFGRWTHGSISIDDDTPRTPYRRSYSLDVAQGTVAQNPVWGTGGGAVLAFSDMLGDNYWYLTLYNLGQGRGSFLENMNIAVSRLELQRRSSIGYGLYRFGGLRYDITDPDAAASYPLVWESIFGGFTSISYPLSQFQRIEFASHINWNNREVQFRDLARKALLFSGTASLVLDNALYGYNGPVDGSRLNLTVGFTTDLLYDNVRYASVVVDGRRYFRLHPRVTLASRGMFKANHGREARLHFLGGSWDLRGWRFFDIRAQKIWFTSHELRFPILTAPYLYMPLLTPFGVVNLRGALFIDAAHAWNDRYFRREEQLNTGDTLGSVGAGLRLNLFGGFVLRYDLGYRFTDGFGTRDRFFRQFFFGYDF